MIEEKSREDKNESNLEKILNGYQNPKKESSNYTIEQLNSYFYELQSSENKCNKDIFKILRRFAKKKVFISSDQFEFLVNLAISLDFKIGKKFLGIIKSYLYINNIDWFLSVVSPDFFEKISIFLPHSRIFKIYRLCVQVEPNNVPEILTEMNIIEPILYNLNNCEALLLYAELLKNENTSSIYEKYFLSVFSGAVQNLKNDDDEYGEYDYNDDYYDYYEEYYEKSIIKILKVLLNSEQCVKTIVQDPDFYISFLQQIFGYLPHNCIFQIYRYCVLADPDNTPVILTKMNIIEPILKGLKHDESILLYSKLLENQNTSSIYIEYYPQIISGAFEKFILNLDESIIDALSSLIINDECVQLVIQDQNFPIIFTRKKYTHYLRISLMRFINLLCEYNKSVALEFASSPIWDFAMNSFEHNNSMKSQKKKIEFNHEFFLFLYNVAESNEGKILLFENDIHLNLFELIKDGEFNNVNDSIKVICQIGLIDNIDVATQLVENGLIDIIAETILSLKLNAQRAAIDCISNIQKIGETNNINALSDIIFENGELMDAVDKLKESDDTFIYQNSLALEMRCSNWQRE